MTFGREKRLLLGVLAALAALPLPLNDTLEWPYLLSYLGGIVFFLRRAQQDRGEWLPPWTMNLLGIAYLPFFLVDLLVLNRGQLVVPVVHLALFTVLVKLFSLKRERDKWQALIGIFFLFLAAMATSVHPSIVAYLAVFLAVALLLLARFASLHLLAGFGRRDAPAAAVPMRGFLTVSVVIALGLAVPLFALLPRVNNPYLPGRGIGSGAFSETTGFSDGVTLDSIGRIRTSREVALRIRYNRVSPDLEALRDSMRFKAATFDRYAGNRWERAPRLDTLPRPRTVRMLKLAAMPAVRWATLWLKPLSSRSLVLPVEAVEIEAPTPVEIDHGGALSLSAPPSEVLEYRVGLASQSLSLAPPPRADQRSGALDLSEVTPSMRRLAAEVMGEGTAQERARRLESHLRNEYEYTLDFVGRSGNDPLGDFLFVYKNGHCEYFASAMVLLLRSQGIPARLVTGFLGAEYNPLEDYFIVRHSNAHAWVEAYLPELGVWQTFDPTPASGRPGIARASVWSLTLQAWDSILFGWDRYVLGYGFQDQLSFFARMRRAWQGLFGPDGEPEEPSSELAGISAESLVTDAQSRLEALSRPALASSVLILGVVGLWAARRYRRPSSAVTAYRRLRRRLARAGLGVSAAEPPLALRHAATKRWPAAAGAMGRVFDLYLMESFGGRRLGESERGELATALAETLRTVGKTS